MVTVPTALAIAEIATNQKVEGGGEYYIISRSFGINIGAAIGTALYFSRAISVAFYIIAFAEAFDPVFDWFNNQFDLNIADNRLISIPALLLFDFFDVEKRSQHGNESSLCGGGLYFSLPCFSFLWEIQDMQRKIPTNI